MSNIIVVVGAGVTGLTTALLLSRNRANKVTIVAKHMPGDYDIEYASPWAGANIMPMSTEEHSALERRTWEVLKRITQEVPEAGIHFQKCQILRRQDDMLKATGPMSSLFDPNPWYQKMFDDFRELKQEEITGANDSGCEFTSICINTAVYLPWLLGQCISNGVVVKRAVLSDINAAKQLSHTGLPAPVIINATGLGSLKLGGVEDTALMPARGQIVVVRNECSHMIASSQTEDGPKELLYIMQRAAGGGTILGGTMDLGNWESKPDPNIAVRIMKRAVKAQPQLTGGRGIEGLDIIRHGVGLRPYRKGGVRIQEEQLDDGTWIIHNYGHSGWGYQGSWGCAEIAVRLFHKVCTAQGAKL